jgi:very-short-patch-repair endonuclease/rubrerythrin
MIKSIANLRPELLEDWYYKKNKVKPNEVTIGSDVKIYWKCHTCGHEWSTEAKNRAIHSNGCKVCSKRWNTSFNELTLLYYLKQVFDSVEHSYQLDIQEFNEVDIYIPNLSLVIEYDSFYRHVDRDENDNLKSKYLLESGYHVIRMREKGLNPINGVINISFETNSNSFLYIETIRLFLNTIVELYSLPPYLKKRIREISLDPDRDQLYILRQVRPVIVEPNFEIKFPELSENSWDFEKNAPFEPKHFKPQSNFKVWWKCNVNHNHIWRTQINVRAKGHGCPYCVGIRITPERSLERVKPELVLEWDFSKNDVHPNEVAAHANKKYWWICPNCHSSYDNELNERMAGENCPYCAGKRVNHTNSLRALYPEVADEWHPTKNGDLTPNDFTYGSKNSVYWICKRNHAWPAAIYSRTTGGRGCKDCYEIDKKGKPRIVKDIKKSFANKEPVMAMQWHPTLNEYTAEQISRNARISIHWLCPHCEHEWEYPPNSRSSSKCPSCKKKPVV